MMDDSLIEGNANLDEELKMLEEWIINTRIEEHWTRIVNRQHEKEEMLKESKKFEIFEINYLCKYAEKGQY